MAGYHFEIKNTKGTEDLGGMELADDAAAVAFGNAVIRDLTHRTAEQYDGWTIEIREGARAVGSVPIGGDCWRRP